MKKNGYTTVELIIVFAIFGIFYFVAANKVSYAFSVDYQSEMYNQTISSIENSAVIYGENNLELFDEEKTIYLTIGELAEKNAIFVNKEGVVYDPRNEDKKLNDVKVKLTYKNNKVSAKVLG